MTFVGSDLVSDRIKILLRLNILQNIIKSNATQYPRRKRMRLSSHDYSNGGYYFVTICTHQRACLLGEIIDNTMLLNKSGQMIASAWKDLPRRFDKVNLDSFVVMPNHIHGILILKEGLSLSRVIQAFKSVCANHKKQGVRRFFQKTLP